VIYSTSECSAPGVLNDLGSGRSTTPSPNAKAEVGPRRRHETIYGELLRAVLALALVFMRHSTS